MAIQHLYLENKTAFKLCTSLFSIIPKEHAVSPLQRLLHALLLRYLGGWQRQQECITFAKAFICVVIEIFRRLA